MVCEMPRGEGGCVVPFGWAALPITGRLTLGSGSEHGEGTARRQERAQDGS